MCISYAFPRAQTGRTVTPQGVQTKYTARSQKTSSVAVPCLTFAPVCPRHGFTACQRHRACGRVAGPSRSTAPGDDNHARHWLGTMTEPRPSSQTEMCTRHSRPAGVHADPSWGPRQGGSPRKLPPGNDHAVPEGRAGAHAGPGGRCKPRRGPAPARDSGSRPAGAARTPRTRRCLGLIRGSTRHAAPTCAHCTSETEPRGASPGASREENPLLPPGGPRRKPTQANQQTEAEESIPMTPNVSFVMTTA